MAMTDPEWILAGKRAVVLLPLMLIAIGATLVVALLRDRAARSAKGQDDETPTKSD